MKCREDGVALPRSAILMWIGGGGLVGDMAVGVTEGGVTVRAVAVDGEALVL